MCSCRVALVSLGLSFEMTPVEVMFGLGTSSCCFRVSSRRSLVFSMLRSCEELVDSLHRFSCLGRTRLCKAHLFLGLPRSFSFVLLGRFCLNFEHTRIDFPISASPLHLFGSLSLFAWDIRDVSPFQLFLLVPWWPNSAFRLARRYLSAFLRGFWCWTSFQGPWALFLWEHPWWFVMVGSKCILEGFHK